MKKKEDSRMSRDDVFEHLDRLVRMEAREVILQAIRLLEQSDTDQALDVIKTFDAKIGGMSLADMKGEKLPGVFRAISYVEISLRSPQSFEFGRRIILDACEHIESILKRIGRKGLLDRVIRVDGVPMGALLKKVKRDIPPSLYDDLDWLNKTYRSAKHEHDFSEMESEPDHFFDLDEAIAIYLIARTLGLQLMRMSKKTQEEFEIEA